MSTSFSIAATNAMRREGNAGTTPFTFTVTRTGDTAQAQTLTWQVEAPDETGTGAQALAGNPVIDREVVDSVSGLMFFDRNAAPVAPGIANRWRIYAEQPGGQVQLLIYADLGSTWQFVGASAVETVTKTGVNEFAFFAGVPVGPETVLAIWYPPGTTATVGWDMSGTTMFNQSYATNAITAEDIATLYAGTIPDLQDTPTYDGSNWVAANRTYSVALYGDATAQPGDVAGGAFPSGTVSFAPGETTRTITVDIAADTAIEASERFDVTLSGAPAGTSIATATAAGTIVDDDGTLLTNGGFESGDFTGWTLNFTPPSNAAVITDGEALGSGAQSWDLQTDWTNNINPNGAWSYGDRDGAITTYQDSYLPQFWGGGQGAWARGNSVPETSNPSWMKLTGFANTSSMINGMVGDVISAPPVPSGQAASIVRWTSPGAYTINISGAAWHAHLNAVDTQNWTLALNNVALQSGMLTDWQTNGRDNPDLIQASDIVVKAGDVISMSFNAVAVANWVGLSLNIDAMAPRVNEGRYAVDFSFNDAPASAVIAQSFTTIPGQTYRVAYDFGVVAWPDRSPSLLASVLGGNGTTELASNASQRGGIDTIGTVDWSRDSFTFIADGTTATLRFTDTTNPTFASDALLDNVVVVPVDNTTIALAPGMDSGTSASDGLTNIAAPTFTGAAAAGATITLLDGTTQVGTGTANAAGLWSIPSSPLTDALHSLTAVAKDAGGAIISTSAPLAVRIDTTAPAAPSGLALDPGSDTGAPGDFVTQSLSQTIKGTAEPGAMVALHVFGVPQAFVTAATKSDWSAPLGLGLGGHILTAYATDAAGNTSPSSTPQALSVVGPSKVSVAGYFAELFEGDAGGKTFQFQLTRTDDISGPASVAWSISGSGVNPASASDFAGGIFPSGVAVFSAGVATQTVSMTVAGDTTFEPNETFTITLANPSPGLTLDKTTAIGNIFNDDHGYMIAPVSAVRPEGNAGTTAFTFQVSLTLPSTTPHSVGWSVFGSGTSPASAHDFAGGVLPSGRVTFDPLSQQMPITVNVAGDSALEPDIGFTVVLSDPSSGIPILVNTAKGTILNDDARVSIAATSATRPEGNSGTTAFTFTLARTGNTAGAGTVAWSVAGSGASPAAAADFAGGVLPSGTASFAAGQSSQTVTVNVAGETAYEPNEGFTVTLASPSAGHSLGTATATGTIQNDDAPPASPVSIAPLAAERAEGTGGTTAFTFTLSRTGFTAAPGTVDWSVTGADLDGLAAADEADFAALSGTVSFAAGEASRVLAIPVRADTLAEGKEAFLVALSNPTGGITIETATALGTIANDDTSFAIAATAGPKAEGTGTTTPFTFTVTRQGVTTASQSVAWKVAGTAGNGTIPANGADFAGGSFPAGTLTFAPNETARTVTVPVTADSKVELNERFAVLLSAPTGGATLGRAAATAVILNDDTPPSLSVAAASASTPEGNSGTTTLAFTVTRTGDTSAAVAAKWSVSGVSDVGVSPATASDFAGGALPAGTVSFAAGETVRTIAVAVQGDTAVEPDERFALTLSAPTGGATLGTATALATIANDDATGTGTLAVARLRAVRAEGSSGSTPFTFTVTRSGNTTGPASASWSVTAGSVTGTVGANAADFPGGLLPSGTVTFVPGESARTVTVGVLGDTAIELNESFNIVLANPATGVTLGTASASGVIYNDDSPGTGALSITRATAGQAEGAAGSTAFAFTVTREGDATGTASADWSVAGGGLANTVAANFADFAAGLLPSGRVNFAAGQTVQTVTVPVAADTVQELNDSFTVSLSGLQSGVALGASAAAAAAILNDDFVSTAANQTLTGTSLADTFILGGGLDIVTGGGALDRFLFQPAALGAAATNATTIQDLSRALGETLDLSAIDAIASTPGNDAFTFIGTAAFSGAPGELRWQDQGTQRIIQGNVGADTTPDLTIFSKAAGPLDANWFVL